MGESHIVLCKWQPELLAVLLDLGARVHLVLDRYDRFDESTTTALTAGCARVYRVTSFDSLEDLAAVAVDLRFRGVAVERVVSHSELSQSGARYLELLLGLAADPLRLVAHRDKRLMKELVGAAGVPTARFRSVADPGDRDAVAAAQRDLAYPVIVKPAAGYGSMSTVRVDDADDLPTVVAGFTYDPVLRSRQLIVEEFITGTELAVDAMWSRGEVLSLVVHRYHEAKMNMNTATSLDGSLILARREHPELYERVLAVHERVNGPLGITDGATHMEVFLQSDGRIVFSEVANRVGGGWIPGMLTAHFGRPIWALLGELAVGGACVPPTPTDEHVGAIHIGPAEPGRITAFPTDGELRAQPGVVSWWSVRKVGDRARLSHPSDYYLHVVLAAATAGELEALCGRVAGELVIETVPVQ